MILLFIPQICTKINNKHEIRNIKPYTCQFPYQESLRSLGADDISTYHFPSYVGKSTWPTYETNKLFQFDSFLNGSQGIIMSELPRQEKKERSSDWTDISNIASPLQTT
jgi:hypothetical protein